MANDKTIYWWLNRGSQILIQFLFHILTFYFQKLTFAESTGGNYNRAYALKFHSKSSENANRVSSRMLQLFSRALNPPSNFKTKVRTVELRLRNFFFFFRECKDLYFHTSIEIIIQDRNTSMVVSSIPHLVRVHIESLSPKKW